MGSTLGIHWTVTTHGSWLHGDPRGSWKNGRLIGPDPMLHEDAALAMNGDIERLCQKEIELAATAIGAVCREHKYRVFAAAVRTFHLHLVLAPLPDRIDDAIPRLKRKMSMAVFESRRRELKTPPKHLWTSRKFVTFIYSMDHFFNTIEYVRRHNVEFGLAADPYDWIQPLKRDDI